MMHAWVCVLQADPVSCFPPKKLPCRQNVSSEIWDQVWFTCIEGRRPEIFNTIPSLTCRCTSISDWIFLYWATIWRSDPLAEHFERFFMLIKFSIKRTFLAQWSWIFTHFLDHTMRLCGGMDTFYFIFWLPDWCRLFDLWVVTSWHILYMFYTFEWLFQPNHQSTVGKGPWLRSLNVITVCCQQCKWKIDLCVGSRGAWLGSSLPFDPSMGTRLHLSRKCVARLSIQSLLILDKQRIIKTMKEFFQIWFPPWLVSFCLPCSGLWQILLLSLLETVCFSCGFGGKATFSKFINTKSLS